MSLAEAPRRRDAENNAGDGGQLNTMVAIRLVPKRETQVPCPGDGLPSTPGSRAPRGNQPGRAAPGTAARCGCIPTRRVGTRKNQSSEFRVNRVQG